MKVKKVSKPALHADTYSVACVVNNNAEVLESALNRIKELEKRLAQEDATEDKVKQAREEMESRLYKGTPQSTGFTWQNLGVNMCLEILDKLIEEVDQ